MGYFANKTNGKLIITSEVIKINGVEYDPKTFKKDIKAFKWFNKKSEIYKFYDSSEDEKELFLISLNNGVNVYCLGLDENNCRDLIYEYINTRYFSDISITISDIKLIAETNTKGFVDILIL